MFNDWATTVVSISASIGLAVATLYFKWLIGSLKKLESRIDINSNLTLNVEKNTRVLLDKHEDMDQTRHEENLYRFEKISVALARLGSSNGTYEKKDN